MPTEIPTFDEQLSLGVHAETGPTANPEQFGAQVGEAMQTMGNKIVEGSSKITDLASMFGHMQAQQYVSKTMMDHRNAVDKYMADPKNYTDPNFSKNVDEMLKGGLVDAQKNAPNLLARNQVTIEYNDLHANRLESAYRTQTEVSLQKSFNDYAIAPNALLDNWRTNLNNPNVDATAETYKQTDELFKNIDRTLGTVAPQMARELKDQVTSQMAYGVVNSNPDLAEKILNRGYLEGRTRHFLEDAIQTARGAQDLSAKQTALDFSSGLLKKAEMFPDQVIQGPDAKYFEAHGFKPKEASTMAAKIQSQLDVNKDFATTRDSITGMNETGLLKKQDELYNNLKSLDANSDKFNHDSQVFGRLQKFIEESRTVMHEDPIKYLTQYNKEISSAAAAYRDNPSPDKFNNMVSMQLKYQGAAPVNSEGVAADGDHYLNLAMHELHVMDKQTAESSVKDIMGSGPKTAGQKLHSIIQQYQPDVQGIALSDLMNHGKLPIETYAMERTFGAPFSDKLNGSILMAKELRESVGRQKGSTEADLTKLLDANTTWLDWSKNTAADNFQRQDVVAGFRSAIQTHALGMIQEGTSPKDAIKQAVEELTQWNHETVRVNGRSMQVIKNQYTGSAEAFEHAVRDSINTLDINRINLVNDNHSPIFPVALMAGHTEVQNEAIRSILATKVFPNLNPDGASYSLYVRGQGNDFQLRDKEGKPLNMLIKDLPTYKMDGVLGESIEFQRGAFTTHWPSRPVNPALERLTRSN